MPGPVFLDSGYLLALELSNDQNHSKARFHWATLSDSLPDIYTTSYVFDEIVTFLNSRNRHSKAMEVGATLMSSLAIHFVHVDVSLFYEGQPPADARSRSYRTFHQ